MVPISDPKTWVPYWNTRDCSQGFCSLYCPQWCYRIFPPPPSFDFHDHDHSSPYFSPLVIAIIGILASGFLLISYYAIMSKYCRNRIPSRRWENRDEPNTGSEENPEHSNHEPCNAGKNGLDEDRIKSIAIFKYKKGDGVIDGSDCPVCLSEFQEDESLRLLPKCSHAFHVSCIDTWLKSLSNCPLCRANIVFTNTAASRDDDEERNAPESPLRDNQHSVISITDNLEGNQEIRRSLSMNYVFHHGRLSVADILRIDHDEDCDNFRDSQLRRTHSLSRGKFLFPKLNRGRHTILPF